MGKGLGRQLQVGFAKEAVRGTAEAAATFWLPFSEGSVEEKVELINDEQALGVIEDTNDAKITKLYSEITAKAALSDKSFPLVLFATLGALATAANPDGATVKDHTITVAQSLQHQSLTVFLNDPLSGVDYKYPLGMIDSLDLDYEVNKFVQLSLKMRAKKGALIAGGIVPSTTTENLFLPQHFVFKLASTVSGLTAATAIPIKSMKLKFAKALEDDDVLGSKEPVDILIKKISVEGELEAIWQNETDFKNAFLAGTAQAMRIDLKNTDVTIGTAANPQITIDLNKVIFNDLTHAIKVGDVMRQTIQFKGFYNLTDSKMISVKATNLQASY